MPPKPIVSKEEILDAAISFARKNGMESVNARDIAEILGCSTKPLFRVFKNMDELKQELFSQINKYCSNYLLKQYDSEINSLQLAENYIRFAKKEPELFKALFMSNAIMQTTLVNMLNDEDIGQLLNHLSTTEKISKQKAQSVYQKMWLLSHGMASIIATNSDSFRMQEAEAILKDAYQGFVASVKCGG